jgi:NNP family nitrate/nitrite transporter-like MFS transporter
LVRLQCVFLTIVSTTFPIIIIIIIMTGTTFRTIGVLFDKELAGPVLGWSSAIASFGAFIIPSMFNVALSAGAAQYVMYGLAVFYASCGVINYWYYVAPGCEKPGV